MNIFVNSQEGRLRAGWRLLLHFVLMIVLSAIFVFASGAIGFRLGDEFQVLGLLIGFTLSTWIARRYLDKRSFSSLGLRLKKTWIRDYFFGISAGCIVMGLLFLTQIAFGWIEFTGYGWERPGNSVYLASLLGYLATMLFVGFYEELVFRGYQIINMSDGFRGEILSPAAAVAIAVLVSSVIFGVLHAWNPNASVISTVNIIIAGVVLALPFLNTGSLAIPVGVHTSWNFFQGGIFGFPVSGTVTRSSVFQIQEQGPDFVTGGQFGPEAGLMGLFGLTLILLLYFIYFRHQNIPMKLHDSFKSSKNGYDS